MKSPLLEKKEKEINPRDEVSVIENRQLAQWEGKICFNNSQPSEG